MTDFSNWFANVEKTAPLTPVGQRMTAAGFHVAHTGGGCLCWEKIGGDGRCLWVCDAANGLGERLSERFLVGLYAKEGELIKEDSVADLDAALAWCNAP